VGDSQGTPGVYATIIKRIQQDRPALLLHCGDVVKRPTVNRYALVLDELAERNLNLPFCPVPGNHDVLRLPARTRESDKRLYRRSFGQPHYWFAYGDTLFVAIDTSDRGLREAELEWLEDTLATRRAQYKTCIAFTHVPPRNPLPVRGRDLDVDGDRLVAVLAKWNVTALFAGHVHGYAEVEMQGLPIYISGGGGADLDCHGESHHYLLCTIDTEGRLTVQKKDVPPEPSRDYLDYLVRGKLGREVLRGLTVLLLLAGVAYVSAPELWCGPLW
jgi:3',5'-cyclic AMP phosphodiesterase CpdA